MDCRETGMRSNAGVTGQNRHTVRIPNADFWRRSLHGADQRHFIADQKISGVGGQNAFCVYSGLAEPTEDGYYTFLYTRNFTEKMRKRIHFFVFPGAVDGRKLGRFHRWVMRMAMKERAQKDPANAQAYPAMRWFVDVRYIEPLVEKAHGILQEWQEKKAHQEEIRRRAQQEMPEE